ncbi:MAG: esterase/lipase family protein [Leptolyngbya sp. IPPAS B-1204]
MEKMKDMVVIVPGITGSVLQKDGKDVWGVSLQAVWQLATSFGQSLQDLKVDHDDDDPEIADLGDGIRATRLVEDAHIVPGLIKIDGYTRTSRLITDHFDVTVGNIYNDPDDRAANFYHFPYDWRRNNRVTAHLLQQLIHKRLKRWREASGAQDAKVVILAHSMGGIISRYYLEVLEGWRDCRALFTFGTPYRGAPKMAQYLAEGYKKLFLDVTNVIRSLPSVYQLLPIYPMLDIDGVDVRIAEAEIPNIDKTRAEKALKFHHEIQEHVTENLKNEDYRRLFTTVPIVGIQQPTEQSAMLQDGKFTVSKNILPKSLKARPDLEGGDGAVPLVSAIPIELSNSFNNMFIAETHGMLQNQSLILEDVQHRLGTNQFDLASIRAPQSAISLALDDLYLPDEPIVIHSRLITTPGVMTGSLQAEIVSVTDDRPALNVIFEQQQEQDWAVTLDTLPAGKYRVKVQTEITNAQTPTPVHELFEVVKAE